MIKAMYFLTWPKALSQADVILCTLPETHYANIINAEMLAVVARSHLYPDVGRAKVTEQRAL
ncbi:MAG: hypothetical protein R2865_03180 [Deinococcales bacterium]